jgi:hypothetical protein
MINQGRRGSNQIVVEKLEDWHKVCLIRMAEYDLTSEHFSTI